MSVIPLRPGFAPCPQQGEANPDVIDQLSELLEKAKTGDILGIAYVSLHQGDFTTYGNRGRLTRGVVGALLLLQHQLCKTDIEAV